MSQLLRDTNNSKHPRRRKKAGKAQRHLQTLAGRQVRELERNLSPYALEKHGKALAIYNKILTQKTDSKDKIYSIHKPFTACMAKDKVHKKYEYGNKIGLVTTAKTLIITGIKAFFGNPHNSKTIESLLEQMHQNNFVLPQELIYDRGGRGSSEIKGVSILTPKKPLKADSPYIKQSKRKKNRRGAAIEPVIGHLKSQFRLQQNCLHGETAPQINAFLAATAWNLRKLMNKLSFAVKKYFFVFFYPIVFEIRLVKMG